MNDMTITSCALATAAFFMVACDRNSDQTTTTTGATTRNPVPTIQLGGDPNDMAIERITEARCARELACNHLGANKKWSDVAACRREMRQNIHGDYRQSECHVVQTDKLQSCIDAIRDEKCDAILDMTSVGACRKGNICKD